MSQSGPSHYFDIGDVVEHGDSSEGTFGADMRLATLTDVEEGRADHVNDMMVDPTGDLGSFAGPEALVQALALEFMKGNEPFSLSHPDSGEMRTYETQFSTHASGHDNVRSVENVTVRESTRSYPEEIEVSMTLNMDDGGEYDMEFFVGETDSIQ